jgi:hypothetical protein
VIAVVRPANSRATGAIHRLGMRWVGETDKYHRLHLQLYQLRPDDLATYYPGAPTHRRIEAGNHVAVPPHAVAATGRAETIDHR